METIGQILKNTREKKALSVEEVSKQTKIHHKVITALEADSFDELPAPLYVKGFLRRYGRFLDIDTEVLVKRYMAEHGYRPKQVLSFDEVGLGTSKTGEYIIQPLLRGLIIAIALLVVYNIGNVIVKKIQLHRSTAGAEKKLSGSDFIDSQAGFTVDPATVAGTPPGQKTTGRAGTLSAVEGESSVQKKKEQPVRLKVSVKADCWLQVKSDGQIVFNGIMKHGTTEFWEAQKSINIWTGKAEVMSLEFNGQSLGQPGEGVMKNITVTKKGLSH